MTKVKITSARAKGPRGLPLIGSLFRARRDPLQFVMDLTRDYGDVACFRIGIYSGYLLNHPDYFRHVLQVRYKNYSKDNYNYRMLKPVLGEALITADHDHWSHNRKLIQPVFHNNRITSLGSVIARNTREMLSDWDSRASRGMPVNINSSMMKLTLKVITQSLFSTDMPSGGEIFRNAFSIINTDISDRFKTVFIPPLWIPTPRNRRFKKALSTLDRQVYRIIEDRRKSKTSGNDLLDMLMAAVSAGDDGGMTVKQLRDEIMTLLLAGHETTANLLTWTCYLLGRHPEVMNKLIRELDNIPAEQGPDEPDLSAPRYLDMVIRESLRLYPPVWIISRKAVSGDEIGGYSIPAGSTVTLCSYAIHRHPGFWDDPEVFNPDRFSGRQLNSAYFPFGFGPRSCLGGHFAMMEARMILAMILRRYRLNLIPGESVVPDPLVTLRPRPDLNMTLERR